MYVQATLENRGDPSNVLGLLIGFSGDVVNGPNPHGYSCCFDNKCFHRLNVTFRLDNLCGSVTRDIDTNLPSTTIGN